MFQTAIYEVRSNISEWTIHNAKYDKLVGVFQDKRKKDVLSVEFQNPIFLKHAKKVCLMQNLILRPYFQMEVLNLL